MLTLSCRQEYHTIPYARLRVIILIDFNPPGANNQLVSSQVLLHMNCQLGNFPQFAVGGMLVDVLWRLLVAGRFFFLVLCVFYGFPCWWCLAFSFSALVSWGWSCQLPFVYLFWVMLIVIYIYIIGFVFVQALYFFFGFPVVGFGFQLCYPSLAPLCISFLGYTRTQKDVNSLFCHLIYNN